MRTGRSDLPAAGLATCATYTHPLAPRNCHLLSQLFALLTQQAALVQGLSAAKEAEAVQAGGAAGGQVEEVPLGPTGCFRCADRNVTFVIWHGRTGLLSICQSPYFAS